MCLLSFLPPKRLSASGRFLGELEVVQEPLRCDFVVLVQSTKTAQARKYEENKQRKLGWTQKMLEKHMGLAHMGLPNL